MLAPAEAIATCEQALRELLVSVFAAKYGTAWLSQVAKPENVEKWRKRRDEEKAKRGKRGVADVAASELSYADLYDLRELAAKYWDLVTPALGKKAETGALLKRLDDLRNTVAHSRELLVFERDLLSGIAGEIRNRVTIFMSSKDPDGQWYPRIESVSDSLGNRWTAPSRPGLQTGMVLSPGQRVSFECRGTDPQDRELEWWVWLSTRGRYKDRTRGRDVELVWDVTEDDVAEQVGVMVHMASADAPYHRHGRNKHDELVVLFYRVNPPAT